MVSAGYQPRAVWRRIRLHTVLLVLALWLFAIVGTASAHAEDIDINPADGTVVSAAPAEFSITFNEHVGAPSDCIKVFDAIGRQVDVAPESVSGNVVAQPLGSLPPGWYLATWRAISSDGHLVESSSTFGIGAADEASHAAVLSHRSSEAPLVWSLRFSADLLLIVATGALFSLVFLELRGRRAVRFAFIATILAAGAAALWIGALATLGGSPWLASGSFIGGVLRITMLLGSASLARRFHRIALVLTAAAIATMAIGGHAGTAPITAALLIVHLVAAALWIGAAPALALAFLDPKVSDDAMSRSTRRFSRWATAAIMFVFGGGIALGLLLTDGVAGGATNYILLLSGKVALGTLALAGGAWTRRRLHAGVVTRSHIIRLFVVDSVIVLIVAALSAGLTLGSPHEGHRAHSGHCMLTAGEQHISLTMSPGSIGENIVLVSGVTTAQRVKLEAALQSRQGRLSEGLTASSGSWQGKVVFPMAGTWEATLVVQETDFKEIHGSCVIEVAP